MLRNRFPESLPGVRESPPKIRSKIRHPLLFSPSNPEKRRPPLRPAPLGSRVPTDEFLNRYQRRPASRGSPMSCGFTRRDNGLLTESFRSRRARFFTRDSPPPPYPRLACSEARVQRGVPALRRTQHVPRFYIDGSVHMPILRPWRRDREAGIVSVSTEPIRAGRPGGIDSDIAPYSFRFRLLA